MTILSVFSSQPEAAAAVTELREKLGSMNPRFIIFFASSLYEPKLLGAALHKAFGEARSIGCTTAGEIASGQMLKHSIVLLAFDDEALAAAHLALIEDIQRPESIDAALRKLSEFTGTSPAEMDPARYVGLVLHDGMSVAEEAVMSSLSSATNVPFVGGSAGDDAKFQTTWVFIDGQPKTGAAVLALLEPRRSYSVLKTQSFDVLDTVLTVTDVDESTRTVHTFNDRPAAEEYARALGTSVAELPAQFMKHPLGLVLANGEPFVRSPQQVRGASIVFYCQVKAGMALHVLRARDIVADTRRDLEAQIAKMGGCQGILNFHCILRTLELEAKGQCDAYGALFAQTPTAGFSTYGESYIGHINQTSTMVLFS